MALFHNHFMKGIQFLAAFLSFILIQFFAHLICNQKRQERVNTQYIKRIFNHFRKSAQTFTASFIAKNRKPRATISARLNTNDQYGIIAFPFIANEQALLPLCFSSNCLSNLICAIDIFLFK